MAMHRHLREMWNNPTDELKKIWRDRLIKWRKDNSTVREEHPIRLDRARSIGYKAKQGFVVVRQRVKRGGHQRPKIRAGRRSKHFHRHLTLRKSYKLIAEERVQGKFVNLAVLNSYFLAKDGKNAWYEVIMVDPESPTIKADPRINWICNEKTRVYHGKTRAGMVSRGMRVKGKGAEKARPSRRSNLRLQ